MFLIGCCLLPWMWCLNVVYFWPEFRRKGGDKEIKRWGWYSLSGGLFFAVAMGAWTLAFMGGKAGLLGEKAFDKLDITRVDLSQYGL